MTFALCWALKTRQWLNQNRPIKIKKHGRKSQSVFRHRLDYLRSIVTDLDLKSHEFEARYSFCAVLSNSLQYLYAEMEKQSQEFGNLRGIIPQLLDCYRQRWQKLR